ncbi:outer membrane beta-barrel family protein [uncultured Prevotella sp.]|uniref:outer membrane beta-barrel family protein n=1 Tax=uncultured Prevotella sp. TaxID=159272 RepID=UPI00262FB599|nr:outer membrane beta-barrel family protein [uncultured Prevotella sp.]
MKTILIIVLSLIAAIPAAVGQDANYAFTVKGIVTDSVSNEGEPYATISIAKKEKPGKAVKMAVTKKDGSFSEKVNGKGNFVITISSMGRKAIVKNFSVKGSEKTIDLGTLYITDAKNELEGVEIVMQKPLVKADIDKIEYDIESDPDSKSNSIIEMLRKVPLVTVDGEDNITVNGSSSFKVYVNGRPNNMMTKNPKDVLKSMPANSIKKIEVITDPGPKYDAEGVGGILNIVTIGSGFEGYTLTLGGNVSNRGAGGSLFGTIKSGKLTVSARYNYNYDGNRTGYSESSRTVTEENISPDASNMVSSSESKSHGNFQSGSIEASYEIDSLRLITMSLGLWGGGNKGNSMSEMTGTSPMDGHTLYGYSAMGRNNSSWKSIDGGIDYQRLFKVKDRMLTLSYKINTNPDTNDYYTDYDEISADNGWENYISRLENQYSDNSERTTEQTFQADYTTPIGKMHTIEGGMKYIIRNNSAENDRYIKPAEDGGEYTYDTEQSSHYKHENDIIAAYLGYKIKVKKWSGRLGARYEHTIQDVKYLLGQGDDFRKHFNDLVPSATIGYKLTDMSNLKLGYSMRIYRPGIWYLNPYINNTDPSNISQGNSNLESEKSHSFNIGYSNFTSKLSLNLSMRYSFTNNSIERLTTMVNDNSIAGLQNPTGKDVLYSTYENIGKTRSAALSAYVNWSATKSTRIYANMNGQWQYFSDGKDLSNRGWNMYLSGGIQQSLPKEWRISLNVFTMTPGITLQGRGTSYTSYGININKSFLKKRLTISAFASNFLKKYMEYKNTMSSADFIQKSVSKYDNQRFGISVNYRLGELKASVKKAARSISNDDVKGGGNGSGGK